MIDNYKHKGMRKRLVDELAKKGINKNVLEAINKVPRHLFMEKGFEDFASYKDCAFKIGAGQTISQPYTVAFQTQLLDIKRGEKILEIGTGSGYQTAVLLEMGAKVYTIERQKELFDKTKVLLPELGYKPSFFYGDGYKGQPIFAPYDKIIVTCGAPEIPALLVTQMRVGALMVIPVGEGEVQEMNLVLKVSDNQTEKTAFGKFSFVPMLAERAKSN